MDFDKAARIEMPAQNGGRRAGDPALSGKGANGCLSALNHDGRRGEQVVGPSLPCQNPAPGESSGFSVDQAQNEGSRRRCPCKLSSFGPLTSRPALPPSPEWRAGHGRTGRDWQAGGPEAGSAGTQNGIGRGKDGVVANALDMLAASLTSVRSGGRRG